MTFPHSLLSPLRQIALSAVLGILVVAALSLPGNAQRSQSIRLQAPAGALPAVQNVNVDGYDAAVIPNGRLVTPVGKEFNVGAPKPFGLAVSKDGNTLATINSGIGPFSITLVSNLKSGNPLVNGLQVDSAFLGVVFSPDGSRFYASGGEDGNLWVGDVANQRSGVR